MQDLVIESQVSSPFNTGGSRDEREIWQGVRSLILMNGIVTNASDRIVTTLRRKLHAFLTAKVDFFNFKTAISDIFGIKLF